MVNLPCASLTPPIRLPGLVVEIGIEPRQHHRALRQRGDRMEEFRGRRHRAGRARRDHRPIVMRGQARGFGRDQQIAPRRRLDLADFREMRRAMPCARSAGTATSAANIGRADPAPGRRARPSRRRASPCRPSAAPDRRPMPASRPGRRPPAAPAPDLSPRPRPVSPASAGARVRRALAECPAAPRRRYASASSANASSSSSMSPSATMRGSTTASAFNSSRKTSRAMRPARRVGR